MNQDENTSDTLHNLNNTNNTNNNHINCSSRDAVQNSLSQSAIIYTEIIRTDIEKIIGMKGKIGNKYLISLWPK